MLHVNYLCLGFFQKKFLSDVRSEIPHVRRNIISTGKSVRALKRLCSGLI